ncbi:MAG: LPS export ABC transporter periplasmic protein LptC [Burkholderiaceae bacterium]
MTSRRVSHRYRLLLLVVLAVALALGSFWLLQVMQKSGEGDAPVRRNNKPDYYIEKFNYVRTSTAGEARYIITGARMVHRPTDDTYEITLPVIHSMSEGRPPLMTRAERAIATPDSSQIQMIGKFEADRPASPITDRFHLNSEYLLILPDDDVIKTDKSVALTLGNARLTGTDMYINNATREFRLAQHVHGVYPPRAAVGAGH